MAKKEEDNGSLPKGSNFAKVFGFGQQQILVWLENGTDDETGDDCLKMHWLWRPELDIVAMLNNTWTSKPDRDSMINFRDRFLQMDETEARMIVGRMEMDTLGPFKV